MNPKKKHWYQGCSGFFFNTLIGIPICFILTCIYVGGIDEAMSIILIAIVCTAGISLVIILPCCTLAGFITTSICRAMMKKQTSPPPLPAGLADATTQIAEMPSRDCIAIAMFLRKASAAGLSEATSIEKLAAEGWSNELIQNAINYNRHTVSDTDQ